MSSSDDDIVPNAEAEPQTWDDWTEDEDDDGCDPVKSLFSEAVLPSAETAMDHDAKHFGFDLRKYKQQAAMDDYGIIRCINYIRTEVAASRDPLPSLQLALQQPQKPWEGDSYLQPSIPEDALLFHDFEDAGTVADASTRDAEAPQQAAAGKELQRLQEENDTLRYLLSELRSTVIPAELIGELQALGLEDPSAAGPSTRGPPHPPSSSSPPQAPAEANGRLNVQRVDQTYFDSYSNFGIHRDMLGDQSRTRAYQAALERNPQLMQGARVLDVGCGTGILSMFAARGGASRVVGVDGSSRIAQVAREVLAANGLGEEQGGPISVVAGKVEEIKELPLQQVDVIVSEWMGYALLFETMLETVLTARDRWLKPGGAILPDRASIYLAAASEAAIGLDFWREVYGFSMEPIRSTLRRAATGKALVMEVKPKHIVSTPVLLQELDMCTMTAAQQDFSSTFTLLPSPPPPPSARAPSGPQEVSALVLWFDTHFSSRFCPEHPVVLSTSPFDVPTHWAQTLLALRTPVPLGDRPGAAKEIKGRLSMVRSVKHRGLDISVEYEAVLAGVGGQAGRTLRDVLLFNMDIHAEGEV